jgi:hypothetical protein
LAKLLFVLMVNGVPLPPSDVNPPPLAPLSKTVDDRMLDPAIALP